MSKSIHTPRIHVVSEAPRRPRRTWSDEQKLAIVCESQQDGVVLTQLARRHGITPSQLYDWRYRHKTGLLGGSGGFTRVIPVEDQANTKQEMPAPKPDLVIAVGQRFLITIPSGFDMTAAATLLRGLA